MVVFGPGHIERTAQPGGEIRVSGTDRLSFDCRVTGTSIVRFDDSGTNAGADGRNLALVTCWPLDGSLRGPLRYVVHARMR
jgi:sortase A